MPSGCRECAKAKAPRQKAHHRASRRGSLLECAAPCLPSLRRLHLQRKGGLAHALERRSRTCFIGDTIPEASRQARSPPAARRCRRRRICACRRRRRRRRRRGREAVCRATRFRSEREDLRSEHADESDPGDRRCDRRATGAEPVRNPAIRTAVQARHLWHCAEPPELPGRLLHERRRPRPVAERRRGQRVDLRPEPVRRRRLRRAEQLLALAVEPDDQREHSRLRLLHRRVLGGLAGRTHAPRARYEWQHDAHGLLHGPVICERRLHRRLEVRRRHGDQRVAAAVARQEQHARRLDERRLEPGLLRRRRRTGPVLPGGAERVRPVHDAPDEPRDARRAVPVRGLERPLQRLRPRGTDQFRGRGLA